MQKAQGYVAIQQALSMAHVPPATKAHLPRARVPISSDGEQM